MILEIRFLDCSRSTPDSPDTLISIPVTHKTTFAQLKNAIANAALDNDDIEDWAGFDSALNLAFRYVDDMKKPAFPLLAPSVDSDDQHICYFSIIEG